MTKSAVTSLALASIALIAAIPAAAEDKKIDKGIDKGEAELAELLEGYTAGEPVDCLNRSQQDRLRVIDDTALVFRDRGTIYVNRTHAPRFLDDFDIPVFTKFTSQLCRSDKVEMIDRGGSGITGPVFRLTEFIPYTKVKSDS